MSTNHEYMTPMTRAGWAALVLAAALLLAGREAPRAECMRDVELSSAILGGSFKGRWADGDSSGTWVAVLRIESEEWRPDSVFVGRDHMVDVSLQRHYFHAAPLAVLSGVLPAKPVLLTNGELLDKKTESRSRAAETFVPSLGDTIVQVQTSHLRGTLPGTAYVGICSTIRVEHGYAMGMPLATILARPGVARRDSLSSAQDR